MGKREMVEAERRKPQGQKVVREKAGPELNILSERRVRAGSEPHNQSPGLNASERPRCIRPSAG